MGIHGGQGLSASFGGEYAENFIGAQSRQEFFELYAAQVSAGTFSNETCSFLC